MHSKLKIVKRVLKSINETPELAHDELNSAEYQTFDAGDFLSPNKTISIGAWLSFYLSLQEVLCGAGINLFSDPEINEKLKIVMDTFKRKKESTKYFLSEAIIISLSMIKKTTPRLDTILNEKNLETIEEMSKQIISIKKDWDDYPSYVYQLCTLEINGNEKKVKSFLKSYYKKESLPFKNELKVVETILIEK